MKRENDETLSRNRKFRREMDVDRRGNELCCRPVELEMLMRNIG